MIFINILDTESLLPPLRAPPSGKRVAPVVVEGVRAGLPSCLHLSVPRIQNRVERHGTQIQALRSKRNAADKARGVVQRQVS